MDEQLDILSSGPRRGHGARWTGPGRRGWITIGVLAALLACLGVITSLALQLAHQHDTINGLHAAMQRAGHQAPATPALPIVSDSVAYTLPDADDGSFSVVAVAVQPTPGSAARIWLFVHARHARPGQRYGLLEDTCKGQYIAPSDLADGSADQEGNLTIVAPDLAIGNQAGDWIQVYRWADGTSLGGIQGPLTGRGATTFRSVPAC